jgi:hypothetical protein
VELLKVKTARLILVVEKCGQPEVYTLWRKPKTDRHLQSLIKNCRLLTVQRGASATEFGVVGFTSRKAAIHLVFAKSLERFEGKRVVGIKWDLVRS